MNRLTHKLKLKTEEDPSQKEQKGLKARGQPARQPEEKENRFKP